MTDVTTPAVNYRSSPTDDVGSGSNQHRRIFFASFMTLVAAGMGFSIFGGILGDLGGQFGFTKSDLGAITGGGLAGFGFTIIFFSFFADRVGYKPLLIGAFFLHVLSVVIRVSATPVFSASGKDAAYNMLYWGAFVFSLGNGLCEAAINPLTATLFPRNKTHYLNILHAGWPLGLVIGGLINYLFAGNTAAVTHVRWEILLALYALPALYYGFVVITSRFPISEAKAAGLTVGQMVSHVFAPLLLFLFLIHAMIGYVELGTDGWVQNIQNYIIGNKSFLLFVYTSLLMFILRFFAGPIVHKINPLGLLFISAVFGAVGLYWLGTINTVTMAFAAATVFALGKTFYWPTMLGVIGERFPKAGAIAMGLSGGIGMLSAGLLGGPGIGYTQDRQASQQLQSASADAYARVKSPEANHFLFFQPVQGLDGAKVAVITEKGPDGNPAPAATLNADLQKKPDDKNLRDLQAWYTSVEQPHVNEDMKPVESSVVFGGRKALQITALVPATMAVCYLLLVFYFVAKGGYKAVHLDASGREIEVDHKGTNPEAMTGGVPAPVE
jgi:MFS family permease